MGVGGEDLQPLTRQGAGHARKRAAPAPLFACLSTFTRGETIIRQGAEGNSMFIIHDGSVSARVQRRCFAATGIIREATSVRQAIIKEAAHHDLVVMGASAQPTNASPDGRYLFGTLAEAVASKARPTVIVVKTKQSLGLATFEGGEGSGFDDLQNMRGHAVADTWQRGQVRLQLGVGGSPFSVGRDQLVRQDLPRHRLEGWLLRRTGGADHREAGAREQAAQDLDLDAPGLALLDHDAPRQGAGQEMPSLFLEAVGQLVGEVDVGADDLALALEDPGHRLPRRRRNDDGFEAAGAARGREEDGLEQIAPEKSFDSLITFAAAASPPNTPKVSTPPNPMQNSARIARSIGMKSRGGGTVVNVAGMLAFSGPADASKPGRALYAGTLAMAVTSSSLSCRIPARSWPGLWPSAFAGRLISSSLPAASVCSIRRREMPAGSARLS